MNRIGEQVKDWWTKGIQLNHCYMDDWDEIKSAFSRYGLSVNQHGPIITMNELKYVREAVRITEEYANTKEYRELTSGEIGERERKGRVFLLNMYTFPYFSRAVSSPLYERWISEPDEHLKKIYSLNGATMKQKDREIEKIIREAIVFLRKKE